MLVLLLLLRSMSESLSCSGMADKFLLSWVLMESDCCVGREEVLCWKLWSRMRFCDCVLRWLDVKKPPDCCLRDSNGVCCRLRELCCGGCVMSLAPFM